MKRVLLYAVLLLITVGIVAFQAGGYSVVEKLFPSSPTTTHPSSGNSGSGSNNSGSNSGSDGSRSNSTSSANYFEVNAIFNYGNGTITWFNNTKAPKNWNFYNLTLFLTNGRVDSKQFSTVNNEYQILGINGLEQTFNDYWSLWKFCPSYNAWAYSPTGVDKITLSNGGTYGWYYQGYTTTEPPVTGAAFIIPTDISALLTC